MNRIIRLAMPLAVLGLTTGCGKSPEELLAGARASLALEDYENARQQLSAALLKAPEDPVALTLMVQTQLQLGDADGAEGAMTRLQQTGAAMPDLKQFQARIALLRNRPGEALALIGQDSSTAGWRIRAEAHLALGDTEDAANAFEQGMAAGDDIGLAASYARFALTASDVRRASAILQRMVRMAPRAYETLVLAGDLAAARGQTEAAIAAYRKALEAYPGRVAPMMALANQYDATGRIDAAGKLVEQAAELAPDNADVEALQYQLLAEKGEWEKIRLGLQARETGLEPGSGLQLRYAEALLRLGQADQARMLFGRAALVLPGNPYSLMMLGEAQLASGDVQSAWDTLRPLAASTLASPELLENAEKAARAAGDPEADKLRARLHPARIKATMELAGKGDAAVVHHDWQAVLTIYRQLLQQGEDPEVLKRLALAASHLGLTSDAIAYADRALALSPQNPDYLYLAGLVRLNAGQELAVAVRRLEAAAAADPRNAVMARDLAKAKAAAG